MLFAKCAMQKSNTQGTTNLRAQVAGDHSFVQLAVNITTEQVDPSQFTLQQVHALKLPQFQLMQRHAQLLYSVVENEGFRNTVNLPAQR